MGFRGVTPKAEDQKEKKMEHESDTDDTRVCRDSGFQELRVSFASPNGNCILGCVRKTSGLV